MFAKKQPGFYVSAALFFIGYMVILRLLWYRFVPDSVAADTISFLIMVAVVLPLSAISAGALQQAGRSLVRFLRRFSGRRA